MSSFRGFTFGGFTLEEFYEDCYHFDRKVIAACKSAVIELLEPYREQIEDRIADWQCQDHEEQLSWRSERSSIFNIIDEEIQQKIIYVLSGYATKISLTHGEK